MAAYPRAAARALHDDMTYSAALNGPRRARNTTSPEQQLCLHAVIAVCTPRAPTQERRAVLQNRKMCTNASADIHISQGARCLLWNRVPVHGWEAIARLTSESPHDYRFEFLLRAKAVGRPLMRITTSMSKHPLRTTTRRPGAGAMQTDKHNTHTSAHLRLQATFCLINRSRVVWAVSGPDWTYRKKERKK